MLAPYSRANGDEEALTSLVVVRHELIEHIFHPQPEVAEAAVVRTRSRHVQVPARPVQPRSAQTPIRCSSDTSSSEKRSQRDDGHPRRSTRLAFAIIRRARVNDIYAFYRTTHA